MKLIQAISVDKNGSGHTCNNTWCPLCQLVNHVRDNPEIVAQVTQSAVALARSFRDLVDQFAPAGQTADEQSPSTEDNA